MKNKGLLYITIGVLLLLSSVGLIIYNIYEDYHASVVSTDTVNQIIEIIETNRKETSEGSGIENGSNVGQDATGVPGTFYPEHIINPDIEMPSVAINSEYYIGLLEIPSLGLSLPINSEWSYSRLRSTPCRYTGSVYSNDLVIAAHNYSAHFGDIKLLKQGDPIIFTDMNGNSFTYEVDVSETLMPTAVEEMTSGEWGLSLFTCTPGGAYRVTIRCKLVASN